jgi:cobalamin-dependent methionine synthase I
MVDSDALVELLLQIYEHEGVEVVVATRPLKALRPKCHVPAGLSNVLPLFAPIVRDAYPLTIVCSVNARATRVCSNMP